jgi:hypothetical protein
MGLLGHPGPSRMSGHAQDVHGQGLDLHHECKKSDARMPDAWAARNCRHDGDDRRGAGRDVRRPEYGSSPPLSGTPGQASRPGCAGTPSAGSPAPAAPTSALTSSGTGGRPGASGYVTVYAWVRPGLDGDRSILTVYAGPVGHRTIVMSLHKPR